MAVSLEILVHRDHPMRQPLFIGWNDTCGPEFSLFNTFGKFSIFIHLPYAYMKSLLLFLGWLLTPCLLFSQISIQEFPKSLQLYPRNLASNKAIVQIRGTAASGPDSLVFSLTKSDGAIERKALSLNDLNNGQFNLSFELVAGLWSYAFKAEQQTPAGLVLLKSADNVVAGDVFAVEGQSNAQAVAYNGDANIWQSNFIRCFGTSNPDLYTDDNWYIAEGNGYFSPGAIGQWALRMGFLIQQNLQIPVAIINGADPGKPIEFFQKNDLLPADPATNYGRLLQRLTHAGLSENIRAMVFYQGESDGNRDEIHKTLFEALHADWEIDFPNIEAYYVVQVREGCGAPSLQLRDYQRAFEDYLHNTKAVTANGINGHDGCHYSLQGYQTLGEKLYKQVSADLFNTPTGEQLNIRVLSASFTNTLNTQITVVTDASTALTTEAGSAYDFRVKGAGAAVIGMHADGNRLILDLDQSVNAPNASLSYGGHSGNDAWVLNADGYGMFTFYNLLIDNYSVVPNFDIPGIMSGSGNCITLDGTDDFIYVGPVLGSSYTKEAWINWQGGSQLNNIISGVENTAFWAPNGVLSAGHNGAWGQVTDNVVLTPNQWIHVAVSYDAALGFLKLYKNGNLVSQAENIPPHNDPEVYIGAFSGCCTFQGNIDEVKIWDTVRTIEEIRGNMCQKLSGAIPHLSTYFRLDETAGGIAPNVTAAPDGQLFNFQGLGLNEAWRRSGAPIGTISTHTYTAVDQIGLDIASGDSLVLSASNVSDFVHLYFVEEVPNVLQPADGYILVDPDRYFGLFYASQSISNYDLKYFYADNPFALVQEQGLGLLRRRNNAQSYWEEALSFQAAPIEQTITAQGTLFQEYILAIKDSIIQSPLSAQLMLIQSILCYGVHSAVLLGTASGGLPPYSYSLNGDTPQSSGIFTDLAPGTYSVLISDASGNTVTTNLVSIQSPGPLVVSIQEDQNDVMLVVEGGTPPYIISSNAPNADLQDLPNGTYTLEVLDDNGCSFNSFFTIDYQPVMTTSMLDSQFKINPNPSTGLFELLGGSSGSVIKASVLDVTGRTLQSYDIQAFETLFHLKIDLSEEASGIYFLQLTDGRNHKNLPLVKI